MNNVDLNIIETFKKKFTKQILSPIVLYGIGEKTKLLIENLPEYNFVGLLDKTSAGYKLFGIDVLTIEEAIKISKTIIIVANYSSAHIIYQRIANLQKKFNLDIYHMNGELFTYQLNEDRPQINYPKKEDLFNLIEKYDVISFDFFETLSVRKVLFPADIFSLIQLKIKKLNIDIDFVPIRIEAEKIVQKKFGKAMTIYDIYDFLEKKLMLSEAQKNLIFDLEINTELELLEGRKDLIEIVNNIENKKVIISSDMYFPREIIEKLAKKIGIKNKIPIYVSCDLNKSKYDGDLWEYYKKLYESKKILHIGDDDFSDINQPKNYGIDSFKIYSIYEMLEYSNIRNLAKAFSLKIQDKVLLGILISKLFNSCFPNNKTIEINTMKDLGYLFYGPLIYYYILWLFEKCKKQNIKKILFISRDGYILNRLFKHISSKNGIEGIYFYTSRRALSVSSIKSRDDIIDTFNTFFLSRKITYSHFIYAAFGIKLNKDPYENKYLFNVDKKVLLEHTLKNYESEILKNSEKERYEYLNYIKSQKIENTDKLAIINFVSNGVTQHFFEKLLPECDLNFFYFLTKIEMKNISLNNEKVNSLYGEYLSSYTANSNSLIKHFLTAEAVFSSPDEQFIKIENNKKIFKQNREIRNFSNMNLCHDGIENFYCEINKIFKGLDFLEFNSNLIDSIFGLMFEKDKVLIKEEIKKYFYIDDDYAPECKIEGLW